MPLFSKSEFFTLSLQLNTLTFYLAFGYHLLLGRFILGARKIKSRKTVDHTMV
jgi:hypothetical protein